MAFDLDAALAAVVAGGLIEIPNSAGSITPPASPLGWLVNKACHIRCEARPRRGQMGAGGAKCTFSTGGGAGDNNGFRLASIEGNVTIENLLLRGPRADFSSGITGTGRGVYVEPLMRTPISRTGNTSAGLKTITGLSTTADLFSGCPVYGTAIAGPPNFIDTVDSGTQVTLTVANPATVTGATIFFGVNGGTRMPHVDIVTSVIWGFGLDNINLDSVDEVVIDEVDCSSAGRHGAYIKNTVYSKFHGGFYASNGGSGIYLDGCQNCVLSGTSFQGNLRNATYTDNGLLTVRGTAGGGFANIARDCYFEDLIFNGTKAAVSLLYGGGPPKVLVDSAVIINAPAGSLIYSDNPLNVVQVGYNDRKTTLNIFDPAGAGTNYGGLTQQPDPGPA